MSQELHVNPEYPEELPYRRFLDHGFVALVDVMGDDASIVQAARVSYGKGTKTMRSDAALISYLMRHAHSTPYEMVEFKFLVRLPIFIARQMVRHRTACLAEGTEVYFDLPGGIERRGNQLYKLKIEDIWKRFQPTRNQVRSKQKNPHFTRDRVKAMRLRQVNEDTLEIQHTRVCDVYKNGVKPVFRVVLSDGKTIEATADHRFFFENGWKTLKEATGLREQAGRAVWDADEHRLYVNGRVVYEPRFDPGAVVCDGQPPYQDRDWLHEQYHVLGRDLAEIASECSVSTHTIRKWLTAHGIHREDGYRVRRTPWNKGARYRLGPRKLSKKWKEANRRARSGPASNFWKGGVSNDREAIGRWTTQIAPKIHERCGWTCQLCHKPASELHCHHIVPVWSDESLAYDEENLTSLCALSHRSIQGRELEYVEVLGGRPVKVARPRQPRVAWNKLTVAKLVTIERFEYVGLKETYDIEVEGPYHNFIANGIVTHNSINEYSGRYSVMPDRFWVPSLGAIAEQDNVNRQGRLDKLAQLLERMPDDVSGTKCRYLPDTPAVLVAKDGTGISREALRDSDHRAAFATVWSEGKVDGADLLPTEAYSYWVEQLLEQFPDEKARLEEVRGVISAQNEKSYALYQELLDRGVAREIARTVLPLTQYTEWYWKIDLHNLFHFLRLRLDAHAQFEIRALGEAMATFVKPRVPAAWEAFYNDRVKGTFLSAAEREVLAPVDDETRRAVLTGLHERGFRRRRLKEVCRKLNIDEKLVDEMWPPKAK